MDDFTFLSNDQVLGFKQLEVFKKYGTKAATTDFAVVLGGILSNETVNDDNTLLGRTSSYWTSSKLGNTSNAIISKIGSIDTSSPCNRYPSARPVFSPKSIPSYITRKRKDGIVEVEYGEYPQYVAEEQVSILLESMYRQKKINATGKIYTTDSEPDTAKSKKFNPKQHTEYEFNGKKYIRIQVNSLTTVKLSNGKLFKNGDYVWIEVSPIEWLIDEGSGILISKKCLFAGVRFDERNTYTGNFQDTEIKRFMDKHFSRDIFSKKDPLEETRNNPGSRITPNSYSFIFNPVSEEDIIEGCVKSDIAVFLHGASSEGKSARVKQLDPDCEVIYLINATPESLNGRSVYNQEKGEMIDIPPSWYIKVTERCKREPNKIHIVFFDEISNALPSIQSMAFNIVFEREINGKWKLPDNCRIVAAGNDMNDSISANNLAEPLFNRFAHVYINTTLESWLKWASTEDDEYERLDYDDTKGEYKIHPAIYAFIAYKGDKALKSPYTGDKPNANPRKWEMASKLLYKTRRPQMLRSLIGNDITTEFTAFCKEAVITLDDVINNKYTNDVFNMNTSKKYSTSVSLSYTKEEDLEKVRNFVSKLGKEFLALFDSLWIHGNDYRMERIAELRINVLGCEKVK